MKMCQAFAELGNEVILIAPKLFKKIKIEFKDVWHHYGVTSRFEIKLISKQKFLGTYFFTLCAIIYTCMCKCDIIYTRSVLVAYCTTLFRKTVILELHSLPMGRAEPHLFRMLLKSHFLKRIIVITHSLLKLLTNQYALALENDKIKVLPDGVDIKQFMNAPEQKTARRYLKLNTSIGESVVCYTGHLYEGRGIDLILELAKRLPQMTFLIVGGNTGDITKWRLIQVQEKINNVIFFGFVPNAMIPLYLSASDILIMPYQEKISISGGISDVYRWMSPMKMFEYMASGKLIIASDIPVLREILNETNAILCPPKDIDFWQRSLEVAARDSQLREKLGKKAREDAQKYSWLNRARLCLM